MKQAEPGSLTDGVLCYCDDISVESFRRALWARPGLSFDELCRETGVGLKCTSCLLNAETEFVDAAATPPPGNLARGGIARRRWRLSKQSIYAAIDTLSIKTPLVRRSIVPIIKGRGARTIVAMSNAVAPGIGARAPAFRVRAELRDAAGLVVFSEDATVPIDGRYELAADRYFADADSDAFSTASCRLEFAPRARGYFGAIRPHFAVTTPVSMTAVHGMGRGKTEAFHKTKWCNDAESQFVSVINCTPKPGRIFVSQSVGDDIVDQQTEALAGYGALLIALRDPRVASSGAASQVVTVRATSDVETRFNFMVSCGDPPRISLDHI